MLGKALGRRGILRGIAGAGVAAAASGSVKAIKAPPPSPFVGSSSHWGQENDPYPEEPDWLTTLRNSLSAEADALSDVIQIDGYDMDIHAMVSWSPGMKATEQNRRNVSREKKRRSLWDQINDAEKRWRDSLKKTVFS